MADDNFGKAASLKLAEAIRKQVVSIDSPLLVFSFFHFLIFMSD